MVFKNFYFCLAAALLLLSGCATMEKEECLRADWRDIGYEDGLKGHQPERISDHRKACAKHGISPDLGAYNQGREKGLIHYCTPQKGYNLGLRGGSYPDICPPDLDKEFHKGYLTGRRLYLMEEEIEKKKQEIENLTREIAELETRITQKETTLSQDCKETQTCTTALNVIRRLDRQRLGLQADRDIIKNQISRMTHGLDQMKAKGIY